MDTLPTYGNLYINIGHVSIQNTRLTEVFTYIVFNMKMKNDSCKAGLDANVIINRAF